jgi:hypothetical protein
MLAPSSSRSVNPRLAAASGVMKDTVGGIHNLQHLLGSVRVGPKGLARVVPDVHASCNPMIVAARDLVAAAHNGPLGSTVEDLGALVVSRMSELESTLGRVSGSAFRASDRLNLENTLVAVVRDLDGALELVELMVEASATSRVPVAMTDVIRESANRPDTGSGRGRRLRVTFLGPPASVLVRVNPRLALRLFAFAAALAAGKDGVHAHAEVLERTCVLTLSSPSGEGDAVFVAVPPLIELSRRCACGVATAAGARLDAQPDGESVILTLPLDPGD